MIEMKVTDQICSCKITDENLEGIVTNFCMMIDSMQNNYGKVYADTFKTTVMLAIVDGTIMTGKRSDGSKKHILDFSSDRFKKDDLS